MPVEVECYLIKRSEIGNELRDQRIIHSGSVERISYLPRIDLLVFCDINNQKGSVWIIGRFGFHRQIGVTLYETEDDEEGKRITNVNRPIVITGKQQLSIQTRKRSKEVLISLDNEDSYSTDYIPTLVRPV